MGMTPPDDVNKTNLSSPRWSPPESPRTERGSNRQTFGDSKSSKNGAIASNPPTSRSVPAQKLNTLSELKQSQNEGASKGEKRRPSLPQLRTLMARINEPEYIKYRGNLTLDLMRARQILNRLERENWIPKQLDLDEQTMRDIRQVKLPTKTLHDIVVAFLLLLGEYEGNTRVCSFDSLCLFLN